MRDVQIALRKLNEKGLLMVNEKQAVDFKFIPRRDFAHLYIQTNEHFPQNKIKQFSSILRQSGFRKTRDVDLARENLREGVALYSRTNEMVAAHKHIYYSTLKTNEDFRGVSSLMEMLRRAEDSQAKNSLASRIVEQLMGIHDEDDGA